MIFTFLCIVICQWVILFEVQARYNAGVTCIIDKESIINCKKINTHSRRKNYDDNMPSHEPYLPIAKNGVFYNCSSIECSSVIIYSLIQIASPKTTLKYCFQQSESFHCEPVKYNYYKNVDKLLFLSNNIPNKIFYLIDCLAYVDGGRVCHKKDVDSHTKLVDIGNLARPNETSVLSQEEFICEQSKDNRINCDLNLYVPYSDGLKEKELVKTDNKILLKTDTNVIILNYNCLDLWCGYSSEIPTRRSHYEPPGGKMYRCYYANKQQICKEVHGSSMNIYNQRDWLSS